MQVQCQSPPTNIPTAIHHTATLSNTQHPHHTSILSTAIVQLSDQHGNKINARALLDNGSQICMMTEHLSQKLKFKRYRENLPVIGVGGSVTVAKQSVFAKLESRFSTFATRELKFHVVPRITLNLPQQSIDISSWNLPAGLCLADPLFYETNAIDVVLGVSVFYDLLLNEQMRLSDSGPTLRKTVLGWIVAGDLDDDAITHSAGVAISTEEVSGQLKSHTSRRNRFGAAKKPVRAIVKPVDILDHAGKQQYRPSSNFNVSNPMVIDGGRLWSDLDARGRMHP